MYAGVVLVGAPSSQLFAGRTRTLCDILKRIASFLCFLSFRLALLVLLFLSRFDDNTFEVASLHDLSRHLSDLTFSC
jgi:hypothetical protein